MRKLNGYRWGGVLLCLFLGLPIIANAATLPDEIVLTVDATEAPGKILHAVEIIPVKPGALTLYYPKWIPGEHGPTGPVVDFSSLSIQATERRWRGSGTSSTCMPFIWMYLRESSTLSSLLIFS